MIRTIQNAEDYEYIVNSHWRIYSREYHFDDSFRNFIIQSVNHFMENCNVKREQIWILEVDGQRRGSIGIVDSGADVAQLRWLLIEPECRGNGHGRELLHKAIQHAINCKYHKVILWTNSALLAARNLYEEFGFKICELRKEILSNQEITEERWELEL
ncbi:GNAT family N-acetyltransferase [Paenibacillus albiflavus]|uniref:GNAT family N-acetyltransferase n=1 Tax=Paenibacillus albiflavus TaxID=2545760 RepID=A0A4R4EKX7_9BACL|nr:GNAT family N-acetyltransferase [Paenibacillus albiflavus]TCZ80874.1 GNAT family N-acetyltransferase [Paenibacillus albiflavus]